MCFTAAADKVKNENFIHDKSISSSMFQSSTDLILLSEENILIVMR